MFQTLLRASLLRALAITGLAGVLMVSGCKPPPPAGGGGGAGAGANQPAPIGGSAGDGSGATTGGGNAETSGTRPGGADAGAGQAGGGSTGGGDVSGGEAGGSASGSGQTGTPPVMPPANPPAPLYPPADGRWAGLAAPFFAAPDQDERLVALDSLAGRWVVLYFYPKDDTPGCTVEGREFTDLLPRFTDAGAVVFGISADSTESHRAFREKCSLTVDLLSDPAREMMTRYGAWIPPAEEGGRGRLVRCTFLIDPEGRVAHHWPAVNPAGHAAEVLAKLKELQGG